MKNLESLKKLLGQKQNILIFPHHNPDADALGSSMALAQFLKKKQHQVQIISPSTYPSFLEWMVSDISVLIYQENERQKFEKIIQEATILFFLDFSDYGRLEGLETLIKRQDKKTVLIDHHLNPNIVADFELWNPQAAATAELIYDFIELLGDKSKIDTKIGSCIYAGIVTDTSSFKHPSTTAKVHLITAELMELGVDTNVIQRLIYDNSTENRLRFLGYALKEKLTILKEFNTAYFPLSLKELNKFNHQKGDTEGLVNYALSIQGIRFAITFIEKETGGVKMSFRSTGDFAVNLFAERHFDGGGHKNASGGFSELGLEATIDKFVKLLPQYQSELK